MRRIGVLALFPQGQARIAALRKELQVLGWTEGRKIQIDYRATPAIPSGRMPLRPAGETTSDRRRRRFGIAVCIPSRRVRSMKHPDTSCDCAAAATPLAPRWRCLVCGKTAIVKVSILATVCDGDTIRTVEPEVLQGS
jgi:hypothetical protein